MCLESRLAVRAARLSSCGKGHWCFARKEKVSAKGKGELQTYWLRVKKDAPKATMSVSSRSSRNHSSHAATMDDDIDNVLTVQSDMEKHMRLVDWNTEILSSKLKVLVAFRRAQKVEPDSPDEVRSMEVEILRKKGMVIDEVEEVLRLPDYRQFNDKEMDPTQIDLGETVIQQLRAYVQTLSNLYRDNAFHNFEVWPIYSLKIAPLVAD